MTKRDRLEIIHDILSVIRENNGHAGPTQILYKANLSHDMLRLYLSELIESGLISEEFSKKGRKSYLISEKGYNYLKDYHVIRGFIDAYGLQ